ncbi:hypothetical protein H696_02978 [Fonticula alba]|uniref:EF-hand domain-containing protein n=1 Tax=Fonticula alba TaxID=691883 RepID=A0A058Z948_FONAL|nr:hypothetical protein H696_02978 [Fonticula alba]KCV70621.1 hypothetical protein H696_02978 [Fonticula alba]|eukprot:XP_009495137.1 hypothetical protein H696_02978 [Fonticula alba]
MHPLTLLPTGAWAAIISHLEDPVADILALSKTSREMHRFIFAGSTEEVARLDTSSLPPLSPEQMSVSNEIWRQICHGTFGSVSELVSILRSGLPDPAQDEDQDMADVTSAAATISLADDATGDAAGNAHPDPSDMAESDEDSEDDEDDDDHSSSDEDELEMLDEASRNLDPPIPVNPRPEPASWLEEYRRRVTDEAGRRRRAFQQYTQHLREEVDHDGAMLPEDKLPQIWWNYDQEVCDLFNATQTLLEAVADDDADPAEAGSPAGIQKLVPAAENLLHIIDLYPNHIPALYGLAYICFMATAYDSAEAIIGIALAVAEAVGLLEDEEPTTGMAASSSNATPPAMGSALVDDIRSLRARNRLYRCSRPGSGDAPWLDASGTTFSPMLQGVMEAIFRRFDRNRDGFLDVMELSTLVRTATAAGASTSPVSSRDLSMMCQALLRQYGRPLATGSGPAAGRSGSRVPMARGRPAGGASSIGLPLEGFLQFYLNQTLSDPEETRKDLTTFGFDPDSLMPLVAPPPSAQQSRVA